MQRWKLVDCRNGIGERRKAVVKNMLPCVEPYLQFIRWFHEHIFEWGIKYSLVSGRQFGFSAVIMDDLADEGIILALALGCKICAMAFFVAEFP